MEIWTICLQKGGSCKTSSVLNIGAGLMKRGFKVLMIDTDPQCNLTRTCKASIKDRTFKDILTGSAKLKDCIQKTDYDVIPAHPDLYTSDSMLSKVKDRNNILKDALNRSKLSYDYILIDTAPSLSVILTNSLIASDGVIIPALADDYYLQGVQLLNMTIQSVRASSNPDLQIKGILLNRYNPRLTLTKDMTKVFMSESEKMGTKVFMTKIRECSAVRESQRMKTDVFRWDPNSNAVKDYDKLIDELIGSE